MTAQVPPSAAPSLFSPERWQRIQSLLRELDTRQSVWLSGYLMSVNLRAEEESLSAPDQHETPILIAYGGETGNSESLATQMADRMRAASVPVKLVNLSDFRARHLKREHTVLIICSTHGDGDPPEPIQEFYDELTGERSPKLNKIRFAVLALGDSSYDHYCQTGKEIDCRLVELGATRLAPRCDCDVDFDEPANKWMQQMLEVLVDRGSAEPLTSEPAQQLVSEFSKGHTKQNPCEVEILENSRLSDSGRHSAIHHIAFAYDDCEFAISPGDAIGVFAHNSDCLVSAVLAATSLSSEEMVNVKGSSQPLALALKTALDLVVPGKRLLDHWVHLADSPELLQIYHTGTTWQREFLRSHQVLDLLEKYPAFPDAQEFVDCMRPLQPRLYDVANAFPDVDGEMQILVKHFHYAIADREETGVASDYLLSLEPGDNVHVYPHKNVRFRLPESHNVPLLLIADGTGVAPYRAFIQALESRAERNPCWLVFSEQHYEEDFLYQVDWQKAHSAGCLQFVDAVFYNDDPEQSLESAIQNHSDRLLDWIRQGAHLYFCGDKERLTTCEAALQKFYESTVDNPRISGDSSWKQFDMDRRIHRNLY